MKSYRLVGVVLLFVFFSQSAQADFAELNGWVSQLLSSVRGRSAEHYAKLHHVLMPANCPDLLQHKWDFLPFGYPRRLKTAGLEINALTGTEKAWLQKILGATLSEQGLRKVESARRQDEEIHNRPELLLDDRFKPDMYGYDKYALAVFGSPLSGDYLVSLQGHHMYLAIPVTQKKGGLSTPLFFGEYPKITELSPSEEAARTLAALIQSRQGAGVVDARGIQSLAIRPSNALGVFGPEAIANSLPLSQMTEKEAFAVDKLIDTFLTNFPLSVKTAYWWEIENIKKYAPERIAFRWEGDLTAGMRNHFHLLIGLKEDGSAAFAIDQENITDAKGEHIHSVFWSSHNFGGL